MGPAVEAPRLVIFDLLASVVAVVDGAWGCDIVAVSEEFPILPKAFEAVAEEAPKVDDDVLVLSMPLSCGLLETGKKLDLGVSVDGVDAPLLKVALLAAAFAKRFVLDADVGDFTVLLEGAAVPVGFEKLNEGADDCFGLFENNEGALVVLAA